MNTRILSITALWFHCSFTEWCVIGKNELLVKNGLGILSPNPIAYVIMYIVRVTISADRPRCLFVVFRRLYWHNFYLRSFLLSPSLVTSFYQTITVQMSDVPLFNTTFVGLVYYVLWIPTFVELHTECVPGHNFQTLTDLTYARNKETTTVHFPDTNAT